MTDHILTATSALVACMFIRALIASFRRGGRWGDRVVFIGKGWRR